MFDMVLLVIKKLCCTNLGHCRHKIAATKIGSKFTAILLIGLILHFGGVASERVCCTLRSRLVCILLTHTKILLLLVVVNPD